MWKGNAVEGSIVMPRPASRIGRRATGLRPLIGIALAFLALGSLLGYGAGMATTPRPPAPPSAVARYMAGVQATDGAAIWASMSADFQARTMREGDTPASFAAFYRQMKERGNRIDQVQYVGGYQTREKGLFVYVTRRLDPGKEPIEIVWVLVTGPEGLVEAVL
jgi:hypothetical protein